MMASRLIVCRGVVSAGLCLASFAPSLHAAEAVAKISTKFPGGNVKLEENTGTTVHLSPDLRGDNPWFYWYFEATARPGRMHFVFPKKVAGFTDGAIGHQGPAISTNRGKNWRWMGTNTVEGNAFHYDFTAENSTVRFAVTIPYVQSDLDHFLRQHAKNIHLVRRMLTESQQKREVELIRIGAPGSGKEAVLLTARHHANETMASYVLEGFMVEAMSDAPDGRMFRERHVLYVVPFVDKDGVENGDQGKNRKPHDHNRDYGEKPIYPEVVAIKQLHAKNRFRYALDLHCPTLVMEDHQVMYFAGPKSRPAVNFSNVSNFAEQIRKGLPAKAPHGPLVWLKDNPSPAKMFSRYFADQENVIMSAAFEMPFAPPGKATDPASCREYGKVMLRAFVATPFNSERPEKSGR